MTQASSTPFAAFAHTGFRFHQGARFLLSIGWQMQGVAIAWQVYAITHSKLHLGYVGLAQFLPIIGFSLVTGHTADRFDRKRIMIACTATLAVASIGLMLLTQQHVDNVWLIYAALAIVGTARAFYGPASTALLANLVPSETLPNAITWASTFWEIVTISGPALGGLVYARTENAGVVYALAASFEIAGLLLLLPITSPARTTLRGGPTLQSLFAGIKYVRSHPILLGAITLDLFAVLLGGSVALLPVFAREILHTDASGLGWLRSAPAMGAFVTALWLAYRPLRQRAGAALFWCVAGFGAATILFGLSRSFWLSMLALAAIGATDMISVYVRQSLLQLGTPDDKRGRVTAVTGVFVSASNELGEFESGVTAQWLGTVQATVAGGVGTLIVVAVCALAFPALRKVNALRDVRPPE